jgi:hypothetical protein
MRKSVLLAFTFMIFGASSALAYVASSTNYRIQFDSVNTGGTLSTSTNYRIEDTVGEVGTGVSTSTSYNLRAGYQQMNETSITITSPSDVTLSPSIPGISGGTANGSAVWTVTTDNAAGYQLTIQGSTSPVLKSATASFADYTPAGAVPDYVFSIATADSEFGFSPEGSDIVTRFKDNGSACNTGSGDTSDRCWDALSTSSQNISQSATSNHPSGVATTVKFRAESGASHLQEEGTYTATVTVTTVSL